LSGDLPFSDTWRMLSTYYTHLGQHGRQFSHSFSFLIAIAAIAALNEELDRSPHAVSSIFFDRTSRQDEATEIRQRFCIGFVVSVHLAVIAWWCERDLTCGLQLPSGTTNFAKLTRACVFSLCILSSFVVWGDLIFEESDSAEISTVALIAFNSLGAMFCLCTTIMIANLTIWLDGKLRGSPSSETLSPKRALHISVAKCLAGALLAMAHMEYCNLGPVVTEHRIPMAGLPPHLDGFRIVHLSDLHIGPTCRRDCADAIVDAAVRLRPDLFAVTGDVIDGAAAAHRAAAAPLARLRAHAPAVMVTGNHDHLHGDAAAVLDLMAAYGLTPLRNHALTIPRAAAAGEGLQVAGVDDATAGLWAGFGANITRALDPADPAQPAVLLAHQPKTARDAVAAWADRQAAAADGGGGGGGGLAVLSGHTHCGQIFPFQLLAWLANPYFCGYLTPHTHYQHTHAAITSPARLFKGKRRDARGRVKRCITLQPLRLGTRTLRREDAMRGWRDVCVNVCVCVCVNVCECVCMCVCELVRGRDGTGTRGAGCTVTATRTCS
jgi:predicted MPP superfamily phosphohydrolase